MDFSLPLEQWGSIKYALLNWFADPKRVLIPLAGIGLVAFLMPPFYWRRRVFYGSFALAMAYLFIISPLGTTAATRGLTLFLPPDDGRPADVIVVLGRGSLAEQERAQAAALLWQSKRAPVILTTGLGEAPRLSTKLTQLGVPAKAQLVEPRARTTEENATRSYGLLRELEAVRLILITDQPHMLRSVLTFQSFGFQVIPYPVTLPDLPPMTKTTVTLREYVGLISYALIGRFQARQTPITEETTASTSTKATQQTRIADVG